MSKVIESMMELRHSSQLRRNKHQQMVKWVVFRGCRKVVMLSSVLTFVPETALFSSRPDSASS
jgi:hypothetical protein